MADEAAARRILASLGLSVTELATIGEGLASDAWSVLDGDRRLVLRVSNDVEMAATYPMEHALMAGLVAAGARVPSPVAGDRDVQGWDGPAFSVTTWVPGSPLRAGLRVAAAPQIAAFVRVLQAIPVEGFGALTVVDGRLRAARDDREAGILAWATRPFWPLGSVGLEAHPPLASRPDLPRRIEPHAPVVRAALLGGPAVILHSDLHEENLLEADGLVHVIDFGEALVGPAAWEIASIAYFLGWEVADATLDALIEDTAERERWRADAAAVGLAFGVYRWHQDHELGMDEDVHDEAFLEATLRRMT